MYKRIRIVAWVESLCIHSDIYFLCESKVKRGRDGVLACGGMPRSQLRNSS